MRESVNALNGNIQQIIGVVNHIIYTRGTIFPLKCKGFSKTNLLTKIISL